MSERDRESDVGREREGDKMRQKGDSDKERARV